MLVDLTPELLLKLKSEGYLVLIAWGQFSQESYTFDAYKSMPKFDPESDAVLFIDEAVKLPFEVLLNWKVNSNL